MSEREHDEDWDEPRSADYDDAYDYRHQRSLPHSGAGIASCIVAACGYVFLLGLFVVAAVMAAAQEGDVNDESPEVLVLGALLFLDLFVALVGLVLAIVGVAMRDRKKLLGWIGLGFNTVLLLVVLALFVIGALVS